MEIVKFGPLNTPQRAYAIEKWDVLCPVCSVENVHLTRMPRRMTREGDGVYTCTSCRWPFLYNPFVDKAQEEILAEKMELKRLVDSYREFIEEGTIEMEGDPPEAIRAENSPEA